MKPVAHFDYAEVSFDDGDKFFLVKKVEVFSNWIKYLQYDPEIDGMRVCMIFLPSNHSLLVKEISQSEFYHNLSPDMQDDKTQFYITSAKNWDSDREVKYNEYSDSSVGLLIESHIQKGIFIEVFRGPDKDAVLELAKKAGLCPENVESLDDVFDNCISERN